MMASLSQSSSWIYPLQTSKTKFTIFIPTNFRVSTPCRTFKFSTLAQDSSKEGSLPEPSSSNEPKPDRLKLALERARQYKKKSLQQSSEYPLAESAGILSGGDDNGPKVLPEEVMMGLEKEEMVGNGRSNGGNEALSEVGDGGKEAVPEAVRIAMENANEYEKNKGKVTESESNEESDQLPGEVGVGEKEVPEAVRMAMGKALEYKKMKGTIDNSSIVESLKPTGIRGGGASDFKNANSEKDASKKEGLKISNIDFAGLNFSDKKSSRGLPAGLVPVADPFSEGDLPEVEILVGDASNFGDAASSETKTSSEEESSDLYKPKVSTWGMFPRPNNISKTFGGGRTIRPGETLETPEDRAAKEARTRQLLAAYKRKFGLNMDPKLKAECKKALEEGDSLMDAGRLKEAIPYYQKVMDKLAFQTELHGLAALQWSICQDSLNRTEEARVMYEKLQSHPKVEVSKKARQFMFSFQAMEMMKVTKSTVPPRSTEYQSYFEAFVEDKVKYTSGSTEAEGDVLNQALPYLIFLASPLILVLLVAANKGI